MITGEVCSFEGNLVDIENNDLLVRELYSKERGVRVEFYGIQLDLASPTNYGVLLGRGAINSGCGLLLTLLIGKL